MNKILHAFKYQALIGFLLGHVFNQKISFHNKRKNFHMKMYTPIIGAIGLPLITITSPFFIFTYYFNSTWLDKFIDNYKIERYHQYGGEDESKYYFPSLIVVNKIVKDI